MSEPLVSLAEFSETAARWLKEHAEPRPAAGALRWGEGSDRVAVFRNLTFDEERAHIEALRRWQRLKSDAGYGSISWPRAYGGAGLSKVYETEFRRLERAYVTPPSHEAVDISMNIEAPSVLTLGNEAQKQRYVEAWRRTDELCCQLFSEPGAGSDLGSIATSAQPDGDGWRVNGQKVWTSGARHADFGYAICRTDARAPRHSAFTAFIIPMRSAGVEVRPIRQMSGGAGFNEVFLTDVHVADSQRVGEVGGGWAAAMTTLGFERSAASSGSGGGTDIFQRLRLLATQLGRDCDPLVRQGLAQVYIDGTVRNLVRQRARAQQRAGVPGPAGSIGKLAYTNGLLRVTELVSTLVGPHLAADTGEWGTYAWSEFVCGAPGMRLGGGSDEIQRNAIGERVLGLPREPR